MTEMVVKSKPARPAKPPRPAKAPKPPKPSKEERRARRGRHPLPEAERKDRLVQARVPEDLDETLREAARQNRVSVSQLIRNVLEDTFTLVGDVVAQTSSLTAAVKRDAQRIADSARGKRLAAQTAEPAAAPPSTSPHDAVYAWQEVVVNRETSCASCARALAKGEKGLLGLSDEPDAPRRWLCPSCAAGL